MSDASMGALIVVSVTSMFTLLTTVATFMMNWVLKQRDRESQLEDRLLATAADEGGEGSPAPVPYERFQQVVGERNKYKTDLDAISAQHKAASESNAELQKALDAERLASLRVRTAVAAGLPLEFAERLQGSTA